MSRISISIDLVETNQAITKKIHSAIIKSLNKIIAKSVSRISSKIKEQTVAYLKNTPTYESLINGELSKHFGIRVGTGKDKLDAILQTIADNIYVKNDVIHSRFTSNRYRGGLSVRVLKDDFEDILSLPEAQIITEKGTILPYMDWLLIRGNAIIISEYEISFESGKGRSGGAIMIDSNAGVWRVPPQYAGTINDNWLTRSIVGAGSQYIQLINAIIKQEIERTVRHGNY